MTRTDTSQPDLPAATPLEQARANGLTGDALARHLAGELGLAYDIDLTGKPAAARFVERVPISFARDKLVLGLAGDTTQPDRMTLVLADPVDAQTPDVVARFLGVRLELVVAPAAQLREAINAAYQSRTGLAAQAIDRLAQPTIKASNPSTPDSDNIAHTVSAILNREDLLDNATKAPVVELANLILFEAVKQNASDVHIQPYEDRLVVRLRIDGVLFDAFDLPQRVQDELISRVKVMGKMDIAEKRLPQDGRATVQVGDRVIDLRIASLPTSYGERVVIRLLDKSVRRYTLDELGMSDQTLIGFRDQLRVEHGLALVTGPTGSGKSTTLYAALQEMDAERLNILTLEDPIEYQLAGVSQTQVNLKKGMTFARGLRNVLRQDPDVIMVGEIRDHETAVMAIQSALTGHLVFSTLHTNDAASAVTRLLDLQIEPYLVASSLIGVLAQRLVRCVCRRCATRIQPDLDALLAAGLTPAEAGDLPHIMLPNPGGCEACRHTGYHQRIGVFELMAISEPIRQLVNDRATASSIKQAATRHGMTTLRQSGLQLVRQGKTTVEEVVRITARSATDMEGA